MERMATPPWINLCSLTSPLGLAPARTQFLPSQTSSFQLTFPRFSIQRNTFLLLTRWWWEQLALEEHQAYVFPLPWPHRCKLA